MKCTHESSEVFGTFGNITVKRCTWDCGEVLVSVMSDHGLTLTFTAAELVALRAVVEVARDVVMAVDGFGPVGSLYDKRNALAAVLVAYEKK